MPSKNKSSKPSEAEIVFARASVTLAKHQRLIASWLPPKSEEVLERDRNGEGDEDEDADLNDYVGHELLGVGAKPPPKDSSGNILKRKDPSLEALRKQLLGKNASKVAVASKHKPAPAPRQDPKSDNVRKSVPVDDDSDDEGRGAMLGSKKKFSKTWKSKTAPISAENLEDADSNAADVATAVDGPEAVTEKEVSPAPKKRKANSYLDELLAEKSKKKKKKKNKGANPA